MNAPFVPGRVSIVMAVYNSAASVEAAIASCLAQDHPDFEVIAVDDGSTDPRVARILASFGSRVRVVRKVNGGLASARNAGVDAATGEYVAWMDDDDLAHPDRIRIQAAVLREHPEVELVSSEFSAFSEDAGVIEREHASSYYHAVGRRGGLARIYPREVPIAGESAAARLGSIYPLLALGNFVHPPTVMVRRATLVRAGRFDTSFRYASDWEMLLRIARLGAAAFVGTPLLRYRRSPSQLSNAPGDARPSLETVRVMRLVIERDPALYRGLRLRLSTKIARAYVHAADAVAMREPQRALGLLAQSLRHGLVPLPSLRVLAKAVLPNIAVEALRRNRKKGTPMPNFIRTMFATFLMLAGCASQLPPAPATAATPDYRYVIGPGDVVNIVVFRNPDLSMTVPVRPDGRLAAPLVDDIPAIGKDPATLARDIEKSLSKFIREPVVTVVVTSFVGPYSEQIRVVGEAAKPQVLPYKQKMTLLDVMIAVGGVTDFADGNGASILRTAEGEKQYRVRIRDLLKRGDVSANVEMRPGDVVIIPQSWF